ncbi:AAA family ATPase [Xanthomonas fragariae]|nr:AAA family ATPase [Xanthomonas fragariae]
MSHNTGSRQRMVMHFCKVAKDSYNPSDMRSCFTLREDNWDDYSYKTMFHLAYHDQDGQKTEIGEVKIGFAGQQSGRTTDSIPQRFTSLPSEYFSIGQSTEYYSKLVAIQGYERAWLESLGDLAVMPAKRSVAYGEKVFIDSLTRTVSESVIEQQFARIAAGLPALTSFDFEFSRELSYQLSEVRLRFKVSPESKPPSNIHVLIGRNGVGKTKILNGMIGAALRTADNVSATGCFIEHRDCYQSQIINEKYFSGVISVSFSAFDPFNPPPNQNDREGGVRYSYIGLKDNSVSGVNAEPKGMQTLADEFYRSLLVCSSQNKKRAQWLECISILESDPNFAEMGLARLFEVKNQTSEVITTLFMLKISSGHAIVLLTLTKLIESVEEKTLVLIDEPESHLHPPLLSAFVRALSHLLTTENAVAIVATHSPVLLQEVPRDCAWILSRSRLVSSADRPAIETFGGNLGVLTREAFKFEVSKSGFHSMLATSVASGKGFDELMAEYEGKVAMEGQAILMSMIGSRDGGNV